MAGVAPHPRTLRPGLRSALIAILASAAVGGGVAAVTVGGTGGRSRTLAPVTVVPVTDAASVTAPPAVTLMPTTLPPTTLLPTTLLPTTLMPTTLPTTLPATTASSVQPDVVTPDVPAIDAKAYAVYDVATRMWLATRDADTPLAVGSVMKLLTSYVVLQAGALVQTVTVPALQLDPSESAIGLSAGEKLTRNVLLRAMLIVSANDAARTLAIDVGGSTEAFVGMMNAAAAQLGLTSTVAANPVGLDAAGAHSSAHDMVTLAALLMQDDVFRQAVGKSTAKLHGHTFSSTNGLLTTYRGADGIKTGHTTEAGYCLVGSASRDGREVIVAVFGATSDASRLAGATALLDWAFTNAH